MLRLLIYSITIAVLFSVSVNAQTCTSYPNTLTNGTTADATQVMANFGCAALLGGANFTGNVGIGSPTPWAPLTIVNTNASAPGISVTVPSGGTFGLELSPSSGGWLELVPNAGATVFNPLVQSGDAVITFTNKPRASGPSP